jgi:hypothetical protein
MSLIAGCPKPGEYFVELAPELTDGLLGVEKGPGGMGPERHDDLGPDDLDLPLQVGRQLKISSSRGRDCPAAGTSGYWRCKRLLASGRKRR